MTVLQTETKRQQGNVSGWLWESSVPREGADNLERANVSQADNAGLHCSSDPQEMQRRKSSG